MEMKNTNNDSSLNVTNFENEEECLELLSFLLSKANFGHSIVCYFEDKPGLIVETYKAFESNKELKNYIGDLQRSQRYIALSVDQMNKNICFRGRENTISLSQKGEMIILDFYADKTCNQYLMKESQMLKMVEKHERRFNVSLRSLSQ